MEQFFIFGAIYAIGLSVIISFSIFLKAYIRASEKERESMLAYAAISTIFMIIFVRLSDWAYYDPRPFILNHSTPIIPFTVDNGFPSGHTIFAAGLAAISSPYAKKYMRIILWFIVLWVAVSRVYLGVHHISDVIGSIAIAIFVSFSVYFLEKKVVG